MRNQYRPRIILSVEDNNATNEENANRKWQFMLALEHLKINTRQVLGVLNGIQENSIMLDDNEVNRNLAVQAMDFFSQDCILLIGNQGFGSLLTKDGGEVTLGKMKVSDIKPKSDDYSYIYGSGTTGEYVSFV